MYLTHERIDFGLLEALDPCCSPEMCLSRFPDTMDIAAVGAKAEVEFTNSHLADSVKIDCTTETDTQFLVLISSLPWFDLQCFFWLLVGIQVSGCRVCVCGFFFYLWFWGDCWGLGIIFFFFKIFFLSARLLWCSTLNLSFSPSLKGRLVSARYQLEGLKGCLCGAGLNFSQGHPCCWNSMSRQDQPRTRFVRCQWYNMCLRYCRTGSSAVPGAVDFTGSLCACVLWPLVSKISQCFYFWSPSVLNDPIGRKLI